MHGWAGGMKEPEVCFVVGLVSFSGPAGAAGEGEPRAQRSGDPGDPGAFPASPATFPLRPCFPLSTQKLRWRFYARAVYVAFLKG